ncbi:MAG: sulfatase-like hydrolase/transferase [Planctomycetes bacterium]|nr:sulfatase-like hydrolase/transferase [Planctomycetota bacterium]
MQNPAISRRGFLRATVGAGVAAGVGLTAASAGAAPAGTGGAAGRPNIVLIMADDLGYECIGADGGTSYKTPVLDAMARRGVRFEHGYAQPLCTPSRAQIMTGIYNVRNYIRFGILDPGQTTFAHLLKKAGYATCIVGKWQLEGGFEGPGHFGFDEYCLWQLTRRPERYANPGVEVNGKTADYTNGEYGPDVVSDYACEFIQRHRAKPFLVYYPMILTHSPFVATPDSADWGPKGKGVKGAKGGGGHFADMVAYMDKVIGKILAKLDALGLRENTLVIFTGDNGTGRGIDSKMGDRDVPGEKGATTDGGTRVPLIVDWPAKAKGKRVCTDLVDFSDVLPTLCEAAGAAVPADLAIDGRSFLPQILGQKGNPREWIYCWYSREGKSAQAKVFARNQRYKLYTSGELYDVPSDPFEKKPLKADALDPEAKRVRQMLQGALDRYKDARPTRLG